MLTSGLVSEEQEFVLLQRLHIALDTATNLLVPVSEVVLPDLAEEYSVVPLEDAASVGKKVTVDVHVEEEGVTAAASAASKDNLTRAHKGVKNRFNP
jgi:hypothetical protein